MVDMPVRPAALAEPGPAPKSRRRRANGTASSALVGAGGFEPPKSSTTDLQSAPFGHSGTLPYAVLEAVGMERGGAGRRTRTPDLLITNQLLYQLSYTSGFIIILKYPRWKLKVILAYQSRFVNR